MYSLMFSLIMCANHVYLNLKYSGILYHVRSVLLTSYFFSLVIIVCIFFGTSYLLVSLVIFVWLFYQYFNNNFYKFAV